MPVRDRRCAKTNGLHAKQVPRMMLLRKRQIDERTKELVRAWISPYARNCGSGHLGYGLTRIHILSTQKRTGQQLARLFTCVLYAFGSEALLGVAAIDSYADESVNRIRGILTTLSLATFLMPARCRGRRARLRHRLQPQTNCHSHSRLIVGLQYAETPPIEERKARAKLFVSLAPNEVRLVPQGAPRPLACETRLCTTGPSR